MNIYSLDGVETAKAPTSNQNVHKTPHNRTDKYLYDFKIKFLEIEHDAIRIRMVSWGDSEQAIRRGTA